MGKTFQQSAVKPDQILALVDPFLFSNSSEVKRDALHGLASLAKTEENKENIGNVGGVSALASLIFGVYQGGNAGNRMKTIGSSSNVFPNDRTSRRKEKTINQPDMIRIAAETLSNLLTHPSNQEKFFHMQGIEKSVELCFLSTKSSIKRALTKILYHLTNTSSRNRKLVLEARGSQGVFKLLSKVDEENNITCFTILKKLSAEAELTHKWEEDIIPRLTGCLKMNYGTRCCALIASVIANLMDHDQDIEGSEHELFKELMSLLSSYGHVDEVVTSCLHCMTVLFKKSHNFDLVVGSERLDPLKSTLSFQVHNRNYGNCRKIIESLLGTLNSASVFHFTGCPKFLDNLVEFVKTAWKKDVRSMAGKLLREIFYKIRDEKVMIHYCYGILSILLDGAEISTSMVAIEILSFISRCKSCYDFCIDNIMSIIPKLDDMGESSKLESTISEPQVLEFLMRALEDERVEKHLLYDEAFGAVYLKCLDVTDETDVVSSAHRLDVQLAKDPDSCLIKLVQSKVMYEEKGDEDEHVMKQNSATRIQSEWRGYKARKTVNTMRQRSTKSTPVRKR